MAKQELRRKILATIATVGGLCCALAVCVWLLLTSSMFSTSIQILMLVCTGGLAAATVGLCIAKISEIRALRKLVQAQSASAQVLAEKQRLAQAQHQAELARQQAEAEKAAEARRLAQAQYQAELARQQAEAQRQAALARQRAEAEKAAVPQPQQWHNAAQRASVADPHRAEQIRLAQAARTGQIPRITDAMVEEQRLAAAARRAEAQRLAKQGVPAAAAAAPAAGAVSAAPRQAAAPAGNPVPQQQNAPQQSAKEQWVHSWQAISLDDDVPAAAPAPAAQPARPRIPHARPVQPMAQASASEAPGQAQQQAQQPRQPVAPPISWPSQPIPSKYYVTGQMPVVTDEMIEAAKRAAQDAQATQH